MMLFLFLFYTRLKNVEENETELDSNVRENES